MALEAWKGGQQDDDSKLFLLLVGHDDLVDDALGDPVFLRYEELVLDVYKLPGVVDEIVVGAEYR